MKKIIYVLLLGFVLLGSTQIEAADKYIKALLFDAGVTINNKPVILNSADASSFLNYNDQVYVPLRLIGNYLNAYVGYDSTSHNIYFDSDNKQNNLKSKQTKTVSKDNFELRLSSDKTTYSYGEPIKIWSNLIYRGKKPLQITHGGSLLGYSITDKGNYKESQSQALKKLTEVINPDDNFFYMYPSTLSLLYLLNKNGVEDLDDYLNKTPRPALLPKGEYKVKVTAHFNIGDDSLKNKVEFSSEISIKVE